MDAFGATRALVVSGAFLISFTPSAFAQTVAAVAQESSVDWRFVSGYAWFSFRDVARTGRPLDASPVSWNGRGLRIEAERTRSSISRMHRLTAGVSLVGAFEYRSPLESSSRPSSDRYRTLDGRYEYRRYLLRDLWMTGFDVGLGGLAVGKYTRIDRSIATNISSRDTALSGGLAVVAAARIRRWSKFQVEVDWSNGIRIARLNHRHSEAAAGSEPGGGGGWIMDLGATADLRLARRTSLSVRYSRGSVAQYSSHRTVFTSHGSLSAGVVYAR